MDALNLGSFNCDRTATVAAVKDVAKFKALDRVIENAADVGIVDYH